MDRFGRIADDDANDDDDDDDRLVGERRQRPRLRELDHRREPSVESSTRCGDRFQRRYDGDDDDDYDSDDIEDAATRTRRRCQNEPSDGTDERRN